MCCEFLGKKKSSQRWAASTCLSPIGSLCCVPPMKSWENNPTTKQGKQIISPQTNCPLEHSAHRTAYTTNLPESLDSLQQKERKILLLSQIMFIEHIFRFSESVFSFLNNLWLKYYWFLRKWFLIFLFLESVFELRSTPLLPSCLTTLKCQMEQLAGSSFTQNKR